MMKICSRCNQEKPLTEFGVLRRNKDGLSGRCKPCAREAIQLSRQRHPETRRKANHTEAAKARVRRFYENHTDYWESHYARHKKKIDERSRLYRVTNREAVTAKQREYYAKNRDACIAKTAAYQRENAALVNARQAEWRKANPDKQKMYYQRHKERNPGRTTLLRQQWKKANPHAAAASLAARRAAKHRATPKWKNSFFVAEIYRLAVQRTKATGIKWEVDHIVPLKNPLVCGLHVEHNLQVIPAVLNRSKGNKFAEAHHG